MSPTDDVREPDTEPTGPLPEEDAEEPEDLERSRLHRALTTVLPALVILAIVAYGLFRPAPDDPFAPGEPLPDFELPLVGREGALNDESLEGRPVVLNLWASWCAPCRFEAPTFREMESKYGNEVRFVGVAMMDSIEGAEGFVEEYDIGYTTAHDADRELEGALDVIGLPMTFFLDADGNFVATSTQEEIGQEGDTTVFGAIPERELERRIQGLIEDTND
jgi:cytochrome c biogenesis protein CcmG, thiol:disulfide interchange protein DsbE